MPNSELTTPGSAAPIHRLSLAAAWSRPSATGIETAPSWTASAFNAGFCFADEA